LTFEFIFLNLTMDFYREQILDHWQNPQNFGKLAKADLVVEQINPLCGDEVTFYFKFQRVKGSKSQSKISDVSFIGRGCAISIASASILSEVIKGKRVKELERITGEKVLDLIGGPVAPARLKCAFLPFEVIKKLTLPALTSRMTGRQGIDN